MKKTILILSLLISAYQVSAFKLGIHEDITKQALALDGFDEKTAQAVATFNWHVDILEPNNSRAHADDNNLDGASNRLFINRNNVVSSLKACKRAKAITALGQALHTVQDLYAHTNAVDNGIMIDQSNLLNLAHGSSDPACIGEGLNPPFAPEHLVSGYFKLYAYIDGSFSDDASCYGTFAFPTDYIENGNCCHLHLNKDYGGSLNGGRTGDAQENAKRLTQDYLNLIYTKISDDPDTHDDLEYYKKMLKNEQIRRMYVIDTTGSMEQDLIAIKQELTSYLDRIIQNEGTEAPTLGLITFKDSEEDQTDYGPVCNKTSIESLKIRINNLFAYGGDDCPESSGRALGAALDQFTSFLDDDFTVSTSSSIFVHTDAPPKDEFTYKFNVRKAHEKNISVNLIKTEGCSVTTKNNKLSFTQAYNQKSTKKYTKEEMLKFQKSSQETYQDVAENTGGINFNVNKTELDKVIPITLFISETGTEVIYSQKHPVNSTNLTEAQIKIDSSMATGKTMIMIKTIDAATLPTITLSRPNGDIAIDTDTDITVNNLSTIVTYTIDSPTQGEWKVSLSNGSSNYLVRAYAQTDFGIAGLSLLKEAPLNIRKVPYMPIEGNPIAGDTLLLRVSLTQAPDTLTLKLLSENQTIIAEPLLTLVENSTKSYESSIEIMSREYKYYYGKS